MSHQPRVDRFCFTCRNAWATNSDASVDCVRTNDVQCYVKQVLANHTKLQPSEQTLYMIYVIYIYILHEWWNIYIIIYISNVTWYTYTEKFATWWKGYACHDRRQFLCFFAMTTASYIGRRACPNLHFCRCDSLKAMTPFSIKDSNSKMTGEWHVYFVAMFSTYSSIIFLPLF